MAIQIITLSCPECDAPVELEESTRHVLCVYCGSLFQVGEDEDEDLGLKAMPEEIESSVYPEITRDLQKRQIQDKKSLETKRAKLESLLRQVKADEKRDISLLPNPAKRNANIAIISGIVLVAVLGANLFGTGGQITTLSIFTIVVFVAIVLWMIVTYFTSRREDQVSAIRQRYKQEFEQVSEDVQRDIDILDQRIQLTQEHIDRMVSEQP